MDIHRPFREYFDIQQTSSGVRVVVKKNSSVGGPRNGRVQLDTERVSIDSPPPLRFSGGRAPRLFGYAHHLRPTPLRTSHWRIEIRGTCWKTISGHLILVIYFHSLKFSFFIFWRGISGFLGFEVSDDEAWCRFLLISSGFIKQLFNRVHYQKGAGSIDRPFHQIWFQWKIDCLHIFIIQLPAM